MKYLENLKKTGSNLKEIINDVSWIKLAEIQEKMKKNLTRFYRNTCMINLFVTNPVFR